MIGNERDYRITNAAIGRFEEALDARLGLMEQRVQCYAATRYASANLARLQAAAEALSVRTHERVVLPAADKEPTTPAAR